MPSSPDIITIDSGIDGATMAATGASILILDAGDHIADAPANR